MSTRSSNNRNIKRRSCEQTSDNNNNSSANNNSSDKKKHLCELETRSGSKRTDKRSSSVKKDKSASDKSKSNDNNFFIVDKIVGHKICHGKSYFKVQWQGYDESEDSWEPEENLVNVLDLVDEFRNSRISDNKSEDNRSTRSRNAGGCYEYVPENEIVATKTKYFDDIRDGKIDLTKNDLYSRVKTRKRLLNFEENKAPIDGSTETESQGINATISTMEEEEEHEEHEEEEEPIDKRQQRERPDEFGPIIGLEKSKFYQSNLFEMTAEFMKNDSGFKKSHNNTIASKSSSNDDISLFNYSISPNTNQSDEFGSVQISPGQQQQQQAVAGTIAGVGTGARLSVCTQTVPVEPDCCQMTEATQSDPVVSVKPHVQRIIDKIDKSFERSSTPQKRVANETHLLGIYAKEIRQGNTSSLDLPIVQTESDLISIDNFDDLKCSILMDKYNLLHEALQNGAQFDWNEKFIPEFLTPLQLAVTKNRVNIVRLLLRYGAAVDYCETGDTAKTPLILASSLGHVHIVKALLDHEAFTDFRSHNKIALYFAIENGRVDVVNMLLKYGTNFYRIADNLSASSLINDMLMTNSVSSVACVDMLALIRNYHMSFITALNRTVTRYLTKHLIKQTCIIFPHQWVSVLETEFHTDFFLDSSIMTNIETPILLLVHGVQADCDFEFWLDNNCCCVESVFVNDKRQTSLSGSQFVTTLWPLNPSSNKLTIHFTDRQLLSPEEKQIRVAVVALSIDCNRTTPLAQVTRNPNSSSQPTAHSRHYH